MQNKTILVQSPLTSRPGNGLLYNAPKSTGNLARSVANSGNRQAMNSMGRLTQSPTHHCLRGWASLRKLLLRTCLFEFLSSYCSYYWILKNVNISWLPHKLLESINARWRHLSHGLFVSRRPSLYCTATCTHYLLSLSLKTRSPIPTQRQQRLRGRAHEGWYH